MRQPRLKFEHFEAFHHAYNRVAGEPGYLPFDDAAKEMFLRILQRLSGFYTVELLAYQIMSNHFHLLLYSPAEPPSLEETARRYREYHGGRRTMDPADPRCAELAERLRDISWFLRDLEQHFSVWWNRTRPRGRRGPLWTGRFKNTVLQGGQAVWNGFEYVESNALRAGLVTDPADYRFGTYAEWCARGRHPFEENVVKRLMPYLAATHGIGSMTQLRAHLQAKFAESAETLRANPSPETAPNRLAPFTLRLDRRVRYWVDGLVIGSELFIRDTMRRARGEAAVAKRRLTRAFPARSDAPGPDLCAYRRLRVMTN